MVNLNWHADITIRERGTIVTRRTVVLEQEDNFIDMATGEILSPEQVKPDHPATEDEAAEAAWKAQGVR